MSSAWSHGTFCRRSVTLPRDRVADHDVLAAGIGQQLQHGAGLDVLEVQRQALAGVCACRPGAASGLALRLDLDDVLVVGLVGELLVVAGGVDDEAGAVAGARARRSPLIGRAEIGRVVAAREVLGQVGVGEVDDDLVADLAQVDLGVRIGQSLTIDAAGAIGTAAEIDAADIAR